MLDTAPRMLVVKLCSVLVMAACGALLSGLHYGSQLLLKTLHELAFLGRQINSFVNVF